MNYAETIDYLFNKTLVFQHVGAQAYKPGLDTTLQLDKVFGCPEKAFKTIHVAGTNGKGSTSHLLAAILQKAGYRVGLYTSPHLLDFRERIRVDGKMVSEEFVCSFVDKFLNSGYSGRQPSFFELATIMAFKYFEHEKVDVAVIEVGLGGRLDSTNIISPVLSVITNKFPGTRKYLNGTPTILMDRGKLYRENLKKAKLTVLLTILMEILLRTIMFIFSMVLCQI